MRIEPASEWGGLSSIAWRTRENAVAGRTKVGAAALAVHGTGTCTIFGGCNIEDFWKASSIHVERAAITGLVVGAAKRLLKILVAAERERFTPCGNCMDFIWQFGGPECEIAFQPKPDAPVQTKLAMIASELYMNYGRQLLTITGAACGKHQLPNAGAIAEAMNEVQDHSFRLGMLAGCGACR